MRGLKPTIALSLLLAGVLIMLSGGCGRRNPAAGQAQEAVVPVELARVARGDIASPVIVSGTVAPKAEVNLVAQVPGKVAEVAVDIGDKVTEGQVLVRLDDRDILARLRQAEALAAQARVNVQQAQANYDNARKSLERTQALFEAGAVPEQQLDQAKTACEVAKVGLEVAQVQVESTAASVEQARVALDNTRVKSPLSGVITARMVDPGEMAQGPLLTIVDLSSVIVTLGITEKDINYLRVGQEVSVEVPTAASGKFKGKVTNISPAADPRLKTYTVKIEIPNPNGVIKPGMTARVTFTGAQAKNVLVIPKQAVINRGGQNLVFLVREGRAAARVVEPGLSDTERVEIRSGLKEGEEIVVKGQEFLEEGRRVEVRTGGQKP
ncbi:MAG: HlyD family secretion protein [Clostridia bacterium]|nr:HlyD family secretion protein [Clostridia bacterium]